MAGAAPRWGVMIAAVAATGVALALTACGPAPRPAQSGAPAAADDQAGYAQPPRILSAQRNGDEVLIDGVAQAGSRLRLQSPDGEAFGATVGADGAWSMPAPAAAGPRLYAVGEDVGGRVLRADGVLAVLPSGRPAALLRAGVGALVLDRAMGAVRLGAVDYDAGGWAFVTGMASPGAAVRLRVDDAGPTMVKADARGRFDLELKPADLPPGAHSLQAVSGDQIATANIAVSAAGPISDAPFAAARQGAAWRIDWRTPGGGVQTSLILDP